MILNFRRVLIVISCLLGKSRPPCNVDSRRFGTLCRFHPHRQVDPPAYEDGTDREFRNVGYQGYMDAGELPKRQQITKGGDNFTTLPLS